MRKYVIVLFLLFTGFVLPFNSVYEVERASFSFSNPGYLKEQFLAAERAITAQICVYAKVNGRFPETAADFLLSPCFVFTLPSPYSDGAFVLVDGRPENPWEVGYEVFDGGSRCSLYFWEPVEEGEFSFDFVLKECSLLYSEVVNLNVLLGVKEKVDFSNFPVEYETYAAECLNGEEEKDEEMEKACEIMRKEVDRKLSYADGELVSLLLDTLEWLNRFVPSYRERGLWFNEVVRQFVFPGVGFYVGLAGERRSTIRFKRFDNGARYIINKLYRESSTLYWFLTFTEEDDEVLLGGAWHGVTPHHPGIRATRVKTWNVETEDRSYEVPFSVEKWGEETEALSLLSREVFCGVLAYYGEKGVFPEKDSQLRDYLLFLPKDSAVEVCSDGEVCTVRVETGEGSVVFKLGDGEEVARINSVELVDRLYSYGTDLILLSLAGIEERKFNSLPEMLSAIGSAGGLFYKVPFSTVELVYGAEPGEDGVSVYSKEDGSLGGFSVRFGSFSYVVEVP